MTSESIVKKALLIGKIDELLANVPYLLYRSGFVTDILTPSSSLVRLSRYVRNKYQFREDLGDLHLAVASCPALESYDWIILGDDILLEALNSSLFSEGIRKRVLPVVAPEFFSHLTSKIELSRLFEQNGIPTPDFRVVETFDEARRASGEFGLPIALKRNRGFGGSGVYKIEALSALEKRLALFSGERALIQQWIEGQAISIDALYLESKLIFFSESKVVKKSGVFAPCSLRKFRMDLKSDPDWIAQLDRIGKTLGIHGFVNMSFLISQREGRRYFYEADIRPTAWLDYGGVNGGDPAKFIRDYFYDGVSSFIPSLMNADDKALQEEWTPIVPHYLRLKIWEIAINYYGVWSYMPWHDGKMLRGFLWMALKRDVRSLLRLFSPRNLERGIRRLVKRLLK